MKKSLILAATGLLFATPAVAEVKSQSAQGFVSGHVAEVIAKPDAVWKRLVTPKEWWSASHSWFGKSEGFYLDAQAGGCFCETATEGGADGQNKAGASVEHMRVIFAQPGKVLRMQGALGPLQSEAVLGILTVAMEPTKDGSGTRLSFNYTVGGYSRFPMDKMAVAVDTVIGEQFASLIKPLGKIVPGEPKLDAEKDEEWSLDPEALEEKPADDPKVAAPKAKPAEAKAVTEKPKAADTASSVDTPKAAKTEAAAKAAVDKPKPVVAEKPKVASPVKPKATTSTDE
jgi:hypothetical protein